LQDGPREVLIEPPITLAFSRILPGKHLTARRAVFSCQRTLERWLRSLRNSARFRNSRARSS